LARGCAFSTRKGASSTRLPAWRITSPPHDGSRLPARGVASALTEVFTSPHGGSHFPARRFSLPRTEQTPFLSRRCGVGLRTQQNRDKCMKCTEIRQKNRTANGVSPQNLRTANGVSPQNLRERRFGVCPRRSPAVEHESRTRCTPTRQPAQPAAVRDVHPASRRTRGATSQH